MRQIKLAKQIQKDLGNILQRDGMALGGAQFITVSKVNVTADLSIARVFVTVMSPTLAEKVVTKLNENKGEIKHKLGKLLKNSLRKLPDIDFFYDDSLDYAEKIEKLLNDIKESDSQKPSSEDRFNPDEYKDLDL